MPEDCKIALRRRGICVIIPTYNNAGTIIDVVTRVKEYCQDVFVVLDGCTDDTLAKLESLEDKNGIIEIKKNLGKGHALRTGFERAIKDGFSYAITLDADGQHYPEDIPSFLSANRRYPEALIVGRRMGLENADRSKSSRFANSFSNLWFFLQTLIPMKDTQTGYRLYPLRRLPPLSLLTSRYEAESGLLVFSAWRGTRIVSLDVHAYYPPREERVSHFRPFSDFLRITALNVVLCLLAVIYGLPRTILRRLSGAVVTIILLSVYILVMTVFVTPGVFIYLKCGRPSEKKKENLHMFICRSAGLGTALLGLAGNKYTLDNRVGEKFSRPAIIICNHQSHLDLLPMLSLTPKLVILTADWVWHNPLYGFIIREADFLPASKGLDHIVARLRNLVDKGYSIAVYPEGTRSPDCSIGRFHQGAFYLAEKFNLDILPVVLYGTGKALPKHGRILHRWPIHLVVDRRISQEELHAAYGDALKSQASGLRKHYITRYGQIADNVERRTSV